MNISWIDVIGLTYLIGLVYHAYRSCIVMAEFHRATGRQFHIIACVLSVVIASVTWPLEPMILAYLTNKKGGE